VGENYGQAKEIFNKVAEKANVSFYFQLVK
jgi:hypothetical protein